MKSKHRISPRNWFIISVLIVFAVVIFMSCSAISGSVLRDIFTSASNIDETPFYIGGDCSEYPYIGIEIEGVVSGLYADNINIQIVKPQVCPQSFEIDTSIEIQEDGSFSFLVPPINNDYETTIVITGENDTRCEIKIGLYTTSSDIKLNLDIDADDILTVSGYCP